MKMVLFSSNDVFAGLLLKPVFERHHSMIEAVYIEKEMVGRRTPLETFVWVVKKSGINYALYQSIELLGYYFLAKIKAIVLGKTAILPQNQAIYYNIPIKYIKSDTWEEMSKEVINEKPDILFCIRFSKILKKDILHAAQIAAINFHGSLLPKYAGLGSILQCLRKGEERTGGTFHTMTEEIDAGHILLQKEISIMESDSVSAVHLKVYEQSGPGFVELVDEIVRKKNITRTTLAMREEYFSFPSKEHIKELYLKKKSMIKLKDFFKAWKKF